MNLFTYTSRFTARFVAAVTVMSLFLSAFPVAFFVALAADTSVTVTILPNPSIDHGEYFMISYSGLDSLDISGWTAVDGTGNSMTYTFPNLTLNSGDSWKVCDDEAVYTDCDAEWSGGSVFNNNGDSLIVKNGSGVVQFATADYGNNYSGNNNKDLVYIETISLSGNGSQVVPLGSDDHVEICHSAKGKNYTSIEPNVDAIVTLPNGHDGHEYDIIPPFSYDLGDGVKDYEGKNWDAAGQVRWENECVLPDDATATIELTKEVIGEENSDLTQFVLLVDGAEYESDDVVTVVMKDKGATPVVVSEGEIPEGYTLEGVVCSVNDGEPMIGDTEVTLDLKDGDAASCAITNSKDEESVKSVDVVATKIVCEDESMLPNDGYTMIDANTATDFLAQNPGCHAQADWQFQWALGGIETAGAPDNDGELADPWYTSALTDANGVVTMSVSEETLGSYTQLSVREVMQDGYVSFAGKNGGTDVSAEMYCHTDAGNYDNLDWVKNVSVENTYYCVAWNAPKKAEVTMCKMDETEAPLAGWQLSLLGEKQGETEVYPTGLEYNAGTIPAGNYVLKASGAYVYRSGGYEADAGFSERKEGDDGYGTYPYTPWRVTNDATEHLGVRVNGDAMVWGDVFSPLHTYYTAWTPTGSTELGFQITDTAYGDNVGSILVEGFKGYTGITDDNGCVTFSGVPFGEYEIEELVQLGWANVSGLGAVVVDEMKETFTVVNSDRTEEPPVTLVASKIVCTDETELPNWGAGGPNITATTAVDWVDAHDSCDFVRGWDFEWATAEVTNPDVDPTVSPLYGAAGGDWNLFGPTDENGTVSKELDASIFANNTTFWVREVLEEGYLPFTYGSGHKTNEDTVSAELYCHTDVQNYDNYDKVAGVVAGETYYCVAWNYELPEEPVCEPGVNLLMNPSFEEPAVETGALWDIFASGTAALGWMVDWMDSFVGAPDVASLELQAGVNGWTASEGSQYAELDSDWQGPTGTGGEEASVMISQEIATIPGATYTLSWDFSPRPGTLQPENQLGIFVDDIEVEMNTTAGENNTVWTTDSYTFEADSAVTKVAFADLGDANSVGTFLDNTSLVCVPEVVKQCSLEIVSDTNTLVVDTNDFAVAAYDGHPSWTASIPGATWIWDVFHVEDPVGETTRTFEETFTVTDPSDAELTINADNGYVVYINGDLFVNRSAENNYQDFTQKVFDITDELVSGENTVRFVVTNFTMEAGTYLNNPAGVLFKITLDGADDCEVTTDRDDDGDGGDNNDPQVTVRGSSGGGSTSPKCELDAEWVDGGVRLSWTTDRTTSLTIEDENAVFFETDDADEVEEGVFYPYVLGGTDFLMTVTKGSTERSCSASVEFPEPIGQVLGEQVSVVPLGAADAGAGGTQTSYGATIVPAAYIRRTLHG